MSRGKLIGWSYRVENAEKMCASSPYHYIHEEGDTGLLYVYQLDPSTRVTQVDGQPADITLQQYHDQRSKR